MRLLTNVLAATALASLAGANACPPLGAVLPPPHAPSEHKLVQRAIEKLSSVLEREFSSKLNMSGISIGVKSIHEDEQMFSYHFTPPVLSGIGTESIDENTIYRVGSISKMMPALVALQRSDIDVEASVLKYLPELRNGTGSNLNSVNTIHWEDITVRSLASHLSGLATDMAQDLALFPQGPWTMMGLPDVPKNTGPDCSGLPGTRPCTTADMIADINNRPAVFLPNTSPVYSNVAYAILGMVIEAATGEKFEDVVQESIWSVAGMESTSFYGPVDSFDENGFVPKGESTWNSTLGVFEAAGGMFSNTVDLIALAEAILGNRLLPPAVTRKWMKPEAHTSSLGQSVGGPWEILRTDNITSDGRVIDVYTKSGDLGLYHALVGIVDDYDIVLSVICAGAEVSLNPHARSIIFSAVISTLIPAIEEAGKTEATKSIVGTYSDKSTNSSMTLKLEDGPGLLIESFSVRGFDVLSNIGSYSLAAAESGLEPGHAYVEGRMYPTDITSKRDAKNGTTETVWRAIFDSMTEEQKLALDDQLFYKDGSCETWFGVDRAAYNFLSLGEFVFISGSDGAVGSIKNPAFNVTLTKVSGGGAGGNNSSDGGDSDGGDGDGGGPQVTPPTGTASAINELPTAVFAMLGTVLMAVLLL